jgi:hypothetical protein
VPMVPPWVPDVVPADGQDAGNDDAPDQPASNTPAAPAAPPPPVPIAPAGRFGPSRVSLGQYARSGSSDDMRRGLGHYIGKGLGGGETATRRFGGTATTAGALYGALSSAASGQAAAPGSPFDPALLAGRSASEIMDALVEAVRPTDGTQDAEASRLAIKNALSELLTQFPDADLFDLSEEQRIFAIERYVAFDVYNRFRLDVGKTIQDKAVTIATAMTRLKDIRDYIKENVSAAIRQVRTAGQAVNARSITRMVPQALEDTFRVFEDYVR